MIRIALLPLLFALAAAPQDSAPEHSGPLALVSQGKYTEAEPLLLRELEARENELGDRKSVV